MSELILIGDRILVDPLDAEEKTDSGIVLPATVTEKERVRSGRVVKVGPGYLMANPEYTDQPWRKPDDAVRYLPLQAQEGDVAYFLRKEAIEFIFKAHTYLIVPHGAVLVLVRPDSKDVLRAIEGLL